MVEKEVIKKWEQKTLDYIKDRHDKWLIVDTPNKFYKDNIDILLKYLEEHPSIINLIIHSYELSNEQGIEKLAQNTTLKAIHLKSPLRISTDAIKALVANDKLEQLVLEGLELKGDTNNRGMKIDIEALSAIAANTTLKALSISWGHIDDEGAKILASSQNLKHLYLFGNDIGDEGALALAQNKNLEHLNLGYNNISRQVLNEIDQKICIDFPCFPQRIDFDKDGKYEEEVTLTFKS